MSDAKAKLLTAALWILSGLFVTSALPGSIIAMHKHRPCLRPEKTALPIGRHMDICGTHQSETQPQPLALLLCLFLEEKKKKSSKILKLRKTTT